MLPCFGSKLLPKPLYFGMGGEFEDEPDDQVLCSPRKSLHIKTTGVVQT